MLLAHTTGTSVFEIQKEQCKDIYWWAVEAYKFFKKITPQE